MGATCGRHVWFSCVVSLGLAGCVIACESGGSARGTPDGGGTASTGGGASRSTAAAGGGGDSGGEPWQIEAELPSWGAVVPDFASGTVSLHAGTAALGSSGESITKTHVFAKHDGDWVEQPLLPESDTLDGVVGSSVAVFEDTLLVGAWRGGGGPVTLFERGAASWHEVGRLWPSDAELGDGFGVNVALSAATALIAGGKSDAYVFEREAGEWHEKQRLVLDEGAGLESVDSVDLDGDTAVVGTVDADDAVAAYVFARHAAGWELQQRLVPAVTHVNSAYLEVAVSGDTMLLSTPGDRDRAGSVHVFARAAGEWRQEQLLLGAGSDYVFGRAVAIHDDVALVAAQYRNAYGGSVSVFERTAAVWRMVQKLESPGTYDNFGRSVAAFGDTALLAAPGGADTDMFTGSALVLERVE